MSERTQMIIAFLSVPTLICFWWFMWWVTSKWAIKEHNENIDYIIKMERKYRL